MSRQQWGVDTIPQNNNEISCTSVLNMVFSLFESNNLHSDIVINVNHDVSAVHISKLSTYILELA